MTARDILLESNLGFIRKIALEQYQSIGLDENDIGIDLDESTAKKYNLVIGIYIKSVEDFSSAEKGGLKAGDVIIEADGKNITKMDELNEIKNSHKIGDEMKLKINRDGNEKEITLTLGEQP